MITLDERRIAGGISETCFRFTEAGDSLVVVPFIPILGVSSISAYTITQGHSGTDSFQISCRYSLDGGLNWSEWGNLSVLTSVSIKENHWFSLELNVIKVGNAGDSFFTGISFDFNGNIPPEGDFYNREVLSPEKSAYFNPTAIAWAINVLKKVYGRGIVPSYIDRSENLAWSDEDYINFWWSLIYPIALRIAITDEFTNLLWNEKLLAGFLEQRGLIIGNILSLEELYYLMSYFYDEISRRGSSTVLNPERQISQNVSVRGELARLIDLQDPSDIYSAIINYWETGWWLGKTSVCGYMNTDMIEDFIVGYEREITDLSKYPLTRPEEISYSNHTIVIDCEDHSDYSGVGLKEDVAAQKTIRVNPKNDYLVIVKFTGDVTKFGLRGYTETGVNESFKNTSGTDSNDFFYGLKTATNGYIMGFLRHHQSGTRNSIDGISQVLQFAQNSQITQIVPVVFTNLTLTITDLRVVCLSNKDIYLESIIGKMLRLILKNRNLNYTNEQVEEVVSKKLLPAGISCSFEFKS